MPAPFLIIDGYNLLHAAGMAQKNYGPGSLERCRNRLLNFIAHRLPVSQRERTTVVFDAWDGPPGAPRQFPLEGMRVLFAEPGHDADTLIEELIAGHSAPRHLVVVSEDHRLQRAAQRRRAAVLTSEAFYSDLERRDPTAGEPPSEGTAGSTSAKSRPLVDGELEFWLQEFGDVPEADALRSAPGRSEEASDEWQRFIQDVEDELEEEG